MLAAAARVYDEERTANSYRFVAKSPIETSNVMRVLLPAMPEVAVTDAAGQALPAIKWEWDEKSHTCLVCFENHPDGITVSFTW